MAHPFPNRYEIKFLPKTELEFLQKDIDQIYSFTKSERTYVNKNRI